MTGNRKTGNPVNESAAIAVAGHAAAHSTGRRAMLRLAILLLALPGMSALMAGCRLPARYKAWPSASSSIQRKSLAENRQTESGGSDSATGTVQHADATSDLRGQVEHAADVEEEEADSRSDRPSRWSRLIDRLRPAKRMPLPLSPEDPDSTLQDEMTAF